MVNAKKEEKRMPANLAEMFFASAEKNAGREALRYEPGHRYHTLSYGQLKKEVMLLAKVLKSLGLKEADRAVIISENRPEWVISDLAMMSVGVASVPVHDVLSPAQIGRIIEETGPKVIFFSDHIIETKLSGIASIVSKVDHLVSFDKPAGKVSKPVLYLKDLIGSMEINETEIASLEASAKKLGSNTLASISYTSGTSGHLKGVMLTHDNFIRNIEGINGSIFASPEDRLCSVLPLSHVFERTAGYYVPMCAGSSISYRLNPSAIAEEMRERKPTVILAAPRFFEKVYDNILAGASSNPFKKCLFRAAFGYKPRTKNDNIEKLSEKMVFSKIKNIFGGELRFFISGGAKLPENIGRFFERAGLVILEGYGLTEASPVIACNRLDKNKFGTVGTALNNLKVKISDSNEILVKGHSVTRGYLQKNDGENMFTEDGYFRTGDLGYVDKEGFLVVCGRSKDLVVLTTGNKVIPSIIEEALVRSPYIEQAMVIGEGKKHIGALIVPCVKALGDKLKVKGKEDLLKDDRVRQLIAAEALEMTKDLASTERIQKFILLKEPFSVKTGELTPKLSLCRRVITARYNDVIEEMYKL